MSGWGDWTGAGVAPKKPSKKALSLAAAKLVKQAAAIALIKSSRTKHVVVSNRTNKKTEKLMVSAVPYPFKTREQVNNKINMKHSEHRAVFKRILNKILNYFHNACLSCIYTITYSLVGVIRDIKGRALIK
jgi:U3 small nucleolar RNA-associated protein 14